MGFASGKILAEHADALSSYFKYALMLADYVGKKNKIDFNQFMDDTGYDYMKSWRIRNKLIKQGIMYKEGRSYYMHESFYSNNQ